MPTGQEYSNTHQFKFEENEFELYIGTVETLGGSIPRLSFVLGAVSSSAVFPGNIRYRFVLVTKSNLKKSVKQSSSIFSFDYFELGGLGGTQPYDWLDPVSERQGGYILKVKIWIDKSFSDFIDAPAKKWVGLSGWGAHRTDISFKVEGNEVKANRAKLAASGSAEFLEFSKSKESVVTISGINTDDFEILIEWIHTGDVYKFKGLSPTILLDLASVYEAASTYEIIPLCESIESYLIFLTNKRNFGAIYELAERIGLENAVHQKLRYLISSRNFGVIYQIARGVEDSILEKAVCQKLVSNSALYTDNARQLGMVLYIASY